MERLNFQEIEKWQSTFQKKNYITIKIQKSFIA